MTDAQIVTGIIKAEGGDKFTWHKKRGDPPTKFGITQQTLADWRKKPVSVDDVRNLQQWEAEAIYYSVFIAPCATLPEPLRETQIHICVLRGTRSGIMMMQGMLAVDVDGWIGKQTLGMVTKVGAVVVNNLMCGGMLQHFALQVKAKPEKKDYHLGWRDRFLRMYHK
jgi:lysozyme family protein